MSGYLDDILDAYAAPAPAMVDAPWSDPFEAEPPAPALGPTDPPPADPAVLDPDAPPAPPTRIEVEPRPTAETPASEDEAGPAPEPDRPPERIIERELRVVEVAQDAPDLIVPDAEAGMTQVRSETHEHLHTDQQITQHHDHLHLVEETDFEPDIPDVHPATEAPAPIQQTDPQVPAELAALEAELSAALARLHGEEAPSLTIISPEDFEAEAADVPPPPDLDPVREVTREVVTEHHHHHTTETRIEPPADPPPRTAAEASRIGPIRFSGDWKTGGG